MSGIEAGQGMSTTPWATSAAYLHDDDSWLQTNIDSGAEYDWIKPYLLKKGTRVAHVVSATC